MDLELAKGFATLFRGYTKAHGRYQIKAAKESGKMDGHARTVKSQATREDWLAHLDGSGDGIGMIPLRDDDTCLFAALDIDVYDLDLPGLEAAVASKKFPLVVCRTKSGGAHLYCFMEEPIEAKIVRERLDEWAAQLGYGGCEVFPKQSYRADATDIGNWINLPYYNAAETVRYAIVRGKPIPLKDFLKHVDKHKAKLSDFTNEKVATAGNEEDLFFEGPPCIQHLLSQGGFPEGTRNDGMYNVAVYLRKRYPDNYDPMMQKYNSEMCSPPLAHSETSAIIKSVKKKEYAYKCSQSPIKAHCQRSLCLKRKFGVGETGSGGKPVDLGSITKYETPDRTHVYWAIEIDGVRIMMDTMTLLSTNNFNKLCAEHINRVPIHINQARWRKIIDEIIQMAETVVLPEDASFTGQFWALFEEFVSGRAMARHRDEIALDKVYQDEEGRVHFRLKPFYEYLDSNRFRYPSEVWVGLQLKECGGVRERLTIKGKCYSVWSTPSPEEPMDATPGALPDIPNEDF